MKSVNFLLVILFFIFFSVKSLAQEVTVFQGFWQDEYYQDDNKITKKEVKALFSKNEDVNMYWKKADTKEIIARVAVMAQLAGTIWYVSELVNDDPSLSNRDKAKNAVAPFIGSLGAGIVGIIFLNSANKSRKKAILTYNKQFDTQTTFRLEPISNGNGLGLALKW